MPIALLPMYDWPETAGALDRFWKQIASNLHELDVPAPTSLERGGDLMNAWLHPELLIGQTCGWPYANLLSGKVQLFGCFDHGLPDCNAGEYYSIYVGQDIDDEAYLIDGKQLGSAPAVAINLLESQSGFHVFSEISNRPALSSIPFEHRVMTGSHLGSIEAVANGKARIAAIDAVSYELASRYHGDLVNNVQIIGQSRPKPALPLITSMSYSDIREKLMTAISRAIEMLTEDEKSTLMIQDFFPRNSQEYRVFKSMAD